MPVKVTQLSSCLGATVEGLDMDAVGEAEREALRQALLDHKVLFFPALHLTHLQQIALGSIWGSLAATSPDGEGDHRDQQFVDGHDEILVLDSSTRRPTTDVWHTDVTWSETPPLGSLLSARIVPPHGGDTLWSDTQAAYEGLAEPIRTALTDLQAVHGHPPATMTTTHPVVRPHPETGAPCLFVNRGWTSRLKGVPGHQGKALLALLFDHMERPEYQTRWSWSEGDAVLWDNRCTMHHAVYDYGGERRRMERVTIFAHDDAGLG